MHRVCRGLLVIYSLLGLPSGAIAEEADWDERSFVGHTRYSFSQHDGKETIKAESAGTASALYRRASIDLTARPVLRWRWKVKNTYGTDIDEQSREGDDYPARVYVVVKTGLLPWQVLSVNYVWSSSGQIGDTWVSAYTNKSRMLAVQAGDQHVERWLSEERNVVADFKQLFDRDVSTLEGYAIMVDSDNSGRSATAWFADIRFDKD